MKNVSKLKTISECVIYKVTAPFENKYKDSDFSKITFYLIHEILILLLFFFQNVINQYFIYIVFYNPSIYI